MKSPHKIIGIVISLFLACASAQADTLFSATLTGPAEVPANDSPGMGTATFLYDPVAHTLAINVSFWNLVGWTSAAHVHATTAEAWTGTASPATQVPSFVGFPNGVKFGEFENPSFDLTDPASYRPQFLTLHGEDVGNAETALIDAMSTGKAYFNIHTTSYPGGEIRGFISRVPDYSATGLLCIPALIAMFGLARQRRLSA